MRKSNITDIVKKNDKNQITIIIRVLIEVTFSLMKFNKLNLKLFLINIY